MSIRKKLSIVFWLILLYTSSIFPGNIPEINDFFRAAGKDQVKARQALIRIGGNWSAGYTGMILDLARFMRPGTSSHPSSKIRNRLIRFLEEKTGERFGDDLAKWRRWLWKREVTSHPEILFFKSKLYSAVDKEMSRFFRPGVRSLIRLDEIDWGGVKVNGIPPLYFPEMIPAAHAKYLNKKDIIFGIYHNGEAKAYPNRIIAWHEMVLDTIGGEDVTLVYCTLCGSAIPFISKVNERKEKFGTSGLLYRSNKLMFDFSTRSLWSAISGEPVVGPLAGSDVRLKELPLVMTTWGEWRRDHPETKVLSLSTGHVRDYGEGNAYREYFSTDRLMFPVPETEKLMKNKEVVLAMRLEVGESRVPVAIRLKLLKKRSLFQKSVREKNIVILTTRNGASRVYEAEGMVFSAMKGKTKIIEERTGVWQVKEEYLVNESSALKLNRIPSHYSFWFGWKARFPDTILIKDGN